MEEDVGLHQWLTNGSVAQNEKPPKLTANARPLAAPSISPLSRLVLSASLHLRRSASPLRRLFPSVLRYWIEIMAAVKKLDVHSATSDFSKTYVFHEEDHTLGNALRHVLMRNPDVDFCGYTIPHPSEPKMHVRLQTRAGVPSDDALRQGVTDLRKVSSTIADAYRKELKAFNRRQKKN